MVVVTTPRKTNIISFSDFSRGSSSSIPKVSFVVVFMTCDFVSSDLETRGNNVEKNQLYVCVYT